MEKRIYYLSNTVIPNTKREKNIHVFNVFNVLTQVGVKQLTDFLRTVTAASDLVDCTLGNCAKTTRPKTTRPGDNSHQDNSHGQGYVSELIQINCSSACGVCGYCVHASLQERHGCHRKRSKESHKISPNDKSLNRLKCLGLPSLEYRRERADLVEVNKIMNGISDVETEVLHNF